MYDKAIRFLEEKNMELSARQTSSNANTKFGCREMELAKNYEELCKAEFELKSCYQKIEDIHTKKQDFAVGNKGENTKWSRKLDEMELAFDKHYTKLKQQQAALLKCLEVVEKSTTLSNEMPCTELKTAADIDVEDVEKIADNIKNDYLVEEMSESD
jgi:hypothetical protein